MVKDCRLFRLANQFQSLLIFLNDLNMQLNLKFWDMII
jgi:hypothetical protein